MKHIIMKQFFLLTIFFGFASTATIAQTAPVATNIKASVVNNDLLVTWNEANATEAGSWEVQGSTDGQSFATIGLVWGADPKATNHSFAFKQKNYKTQSKYKYYRVLYVADASNTIASNAIGLSK
jgi:hypothetical protein